MKRLLSLMMATILCLALCVPAFATEALTEEVKEAYYAEYVRIAAEVSEETELDISVLPMTEFSDEDWRTPQEFRKFITEVAHWNLVCTDIGDGIATYSTASATKTTTVTADDRTYNLSVTGTFQTVLNTTAGQQRFGGIDSITSKLTGSTGTWTQTGYEWQSLDSARTYAITISGRLKIAGAVFYNKLAYVEFHCNPQGVVS